MSGWIKLHRKIKRWEWYDHIPTRLVFIHLLLSVNYEKKNWKGIEILPGQYVISRSSLSKETGISEQQIRTALNNLLKSGDISIETNHHFSIVALTNWEKYQENSDEISNQQSTGKSTSNQPTINQLQSYAYNEYKGIATSNQPAINQQINQQSTTTKEIKKEELKKKEFLNKLKVNASENFSNEFLDSFFSYWTKEIDTAGKMRFENMPGEFDFIIQLENHKQFQAKKSKFLTPKNPNDGKAKQSTLDNIIINRNWEQ